ncbi:hypothetical protein C8R47DRAFT_1224261 [Mycena vitilis]|nr:hypothetical protein C8R47DRAFT_1224261 [Mycena vitilis]
MPQLNKQNFQEALDALSVEIARNTNIPTNVLPLNMIAFGGFVSLFGLRARDTTEDLDYYFPGVIDAADCYIRASDLGTRLSELARPPTAVGRRSSSADSAPLQTPSDLVFEPGFYAMKDY